MQKLCRCLISLQKFAIKLPPAVYSKRFLSSSSINYKYSSNTGVKGIKGKNFKIDNDDDEDENDGNDSGNDDDLNLEEDK